MNTASDNGLEEVLEEAMREMLDQFIEQAKMHIEQTKMQIGGVKIYVSPHVMLPPKYEQVRERVPGRGIWRKVMREVPQPDQAVMIGTGTLLISPHMDEKLKEAAQEQLNAARLLFGRSLNEMMEREFTMRWSWK